MNSSFVKTFLTPSLLITTTSIPSPLALSRCKAELTAFTAKTTACSWVISFLYCESKTPNAKLPPLPDAIKSSTTEMDPSG